MRAWCRLLRVLGWGYLALLFGWLVLYFLTGDRFGYLSLVNLVAVYFFFPLPLVLLAGVFCRSRSLIAGFVLSGLVFLAFWGDLFLPRLIRPPAGGVPLTVMTYNVLAWHNQSEPILDTIRAENPDIVCIQELNRNLAQALLTELGDEYPYQVLEPQDNPSGIGVISKIPVRPLPVTLPHQWIGGPQVMEFEWDGQVVTLVNFHMVPTTRLATQPVVERSFRLREAEARTLAELADRSGPIILAGDANAVPLNTAYRILTRELRDAWREAGFGLGHTFPGSSIPESDRPRIGRWHVPPWLTRIDYVFYSEHWVALESRLARFDGVSDHRGVIAVLQPTE